ncbi:unnamed protein product [Clonostachys rhizophaga]|uniref:SNF2 N-terminal domain-containing protein n=1 Tax=Clonostachys rhizophaga TaxID=160324 RepID=A0A9N9VP02_9HYPO|nr:unnamed protein product [Clonostachys rhizophaga]
MYAENILSAQKAALLKGMLKCKSTAYCKYGPGALSLQIRTGDPSNSYKWLKSKGLDSVEKTLMAPLHSGYYAQHNNKFAVVIIDEYHSAKRFDRQLNEGIRSLPDLHVILLTGTPIYNTWRDLYGQLALFAGR